MGIVINELEVIVTQPAEPPAAAPPPPPPPAPRDIAALLERRARHSRRVFAH